MKEPWGWKVTLYIYGSGDPPKNQQILDATEAAHKLLDADNFGGVKLNIVDEKPHDQGEKVEWPGDKL